MVQIVTRRDFVLPTVRKLRWALLAIQQSQFLLKGQDLSLRTIVVRNHLVVRAGSRKSTLRVGLLIASRVNRNVLLYKKPQPNPTQFYPVFTPWKRRLKALGNKVAPVIPVGPTGSGMDLQHYLGLSLMKLGGMRF